MKIHQFYDKGLAHGSYAVIRNGRMIVIDPARDPQPYYDFATLNEADIAGVIETHPHADFVSSHLEIHQATGAVIYVSKLAGAGYPHESFDDGDVIQLDDVKLKAINTPGHSPDSICVLVEDQHGNERALFTGDTLFVGDVGRPDLRENVGNITAKKEELARQMYHSTREKLMTLPPEIIVYPAHGPGSLCGKNMSPDLQSTIGRELRENYALQLMDELAFVKKLTEDQPFIPKYFGHDVELNKNGAPSFRDSVDAVFRPGKDFKPGKDVVIVDTRKQEEFKEGFIIGSINLQDGEKFETWLGSIIGPGEPFYLIAANDGDLDSVIKKAAKIGYEQNIKAAFLPPANATERSPELDLNDFKNHPEHYTIVDARNPNETDDGLIFDHACTIPLPELRERLHEVPTDKPIVAHCAAGYRSAAAASIIRGKIKSVPVYDLGEVVKELEIQRTKLMLKLVPTADGSNTIYNDEIGENYHSRNGALQESRHVFVNAGLSYFLEVSPTRGGNSEDGTVSILEVGFGTGLNFLLSADLCAEKNIAVAYTGIEACPLTKEMISQTGYDQYVSPELWQRFTESYDELLKTPTRLTPCCQLQIVHCKLLDFHEEKQYDIIYYDAFASARQPEMWNEEAIAHTIRFLKPGGVFVTYAITGNLKRSLKALGCTIEKVPGAAGKREMLRAVKIN